MHMWSIELSVLVGSAHTVLGCYWSKKLGKKKMLGNYFDPKVHITFFTV